MEQLQYQLKRENEVTEEQIEKAVAERYGLLLERGDPLRADAPSLRLTKCASILRTRQSKVYAFIVFFCFAFLHISLCFFFFHGGF